MIPTTGGVSDGTLPHFSADGASLSGGKLSLTATGTVGRFAGSGLTTNLALTPLTNTCTARCGSLRIAGHLSG